MDATHTVSPPFISAEPGLANLRDIGGYPVCDLDGEVTAKVRQGLVYRGPDPAPITSSGLRKFYALNIKTVFDLRSQQQIDRAGGHRELEGTERRWIPVFGPSEYTPEKAALRYAQYSAPGTKEIVDAFTDILTNGTDTFRQIMLHIADLPVSSKDSVPACLLHCTTGNNRTGVFVGVLLALLGVPPSYIAAEYALSEVGLAPSRPAAVARLMKSPVFAGPGGQERCERMVGARGESMLAMLEMVQRKWGSAESYARHCCNISDQVIEAVKNVLIVGIKT
ncbi:putative tyrosine-protein phosphatase [Bisporella sp. PMI_857]|nr:putative tyrosine-protein phosphatase [Bisporella sp. PMI_857]